MTKLSSIRIETKSIYKGKEKEKRDVERTIQLYFAAQLAAMHVAFSISMLEQTMHIRREHVVNIL